MKNVGLIFLTALASLLMLSSCNDVIYDDEGDCSVIYRLHFKYDMNMKFADAFAHEVKSVHVYAFDKNGTLVWQKVESGSALAAEDYAMTLDLEAGDYQFVAWCGLDNDAEGFSPTFTMPEMTVGTSRLEELTCSLNREHSTTDGQAEINNDLTPLYYGTLSVSLPSNDDGGTYDYTMPLMKDTNHLRVILQHLSGEAVDVSKFTFTLEDNNGLMNYDNSLLTDESIIYHTWNTESGEAGLDTSDASQTTVGVAIADLTTARLMADHKVYLTIRNDKGETVVRVPFVDYALLVKGYYNRDMSDQEYLDRQDEYSMTFFLDEGDRWISTSILINSWRIVLSNQTLQ